MPAEGKSPEAGAPEIEITPAMIEAGASALRDRLWSLDLGFSLSEIAAAEVVSAALLANGKSKRFDSHLEIGSI